MVNISLCIYQSKRVAKVLLSNLYAVRHMQVTYVVHCKPPLITSSCEIGKPCSFGALCMGGSAATFGIFDD